MKDELIKQYPLIKNMINDDEVIWINPKYQEFNEAMKKIDLTYEDVIDAEQRLKRFASFLQKAFPETKKTKGIIESPLQFIPNMKKYLELAHKVDINGKLMIKCDHALPISGSIKARGGIYEVLKHAETLALENGLLKKEDDYAIIHSKKFRDFYSNYSIAVGSTGNLGLSIGIMSAKLGFKVSVHMSEDAKVWKKELLRKKGVQVIEYESDYSEAVKEGRKQADIDEHMHFIDDENSKDLFLGYAVSALRLKRQLDEKNIIVDKEHPLFVYLPCGVGGGPGGVTFGLKLIFKDAVQCFFAEPTHSPCMLLGLMTGLHNKISVQDIGIDNKTQADGLAVGRASGFVGRTLENLISGVYTVRDDQLFQDLKAMVDTEEIYLEPSALAGVQGVIKLIKDIQFEYELNTSTHIIWATGGGMVPTNIMENYVNKSVKAL